MIRIPNMEKYCKALCLISATVTLGISFGLVGPFVYHDIANSESFKSNHAACLLAARGFGSLMGTFISTYFLAKSNQSFWTCASLLILAGSILLIPWFSGLIILTLAIAIQGLSTSIVQTCTHNLLRFFHGFVNMGGIIQKLLHLAFTCGCLLALLCVALSISSSTSNPLYSPNKDASHNTPDGRVEPHSEYKRFIFKRSLSENETFTSNVTLPPAANFTGSDEDGMNATEPMTLVLTSLSSATTGHDNLEALNETSSNNYTEPLTGTLNNVSNSTQTPNSTIATTSPLLHGNASTTPIPMKPQVLDSNNQNHHRESADGNNIKKDLKEELRNNPLDADPAREPLPMPPSANTPSPLSTNTTGPSTSSPRVNATDDPLNMTTNTVDNNATTPALALNPESPEQSQLDANSTGTHNDSHIGFSSTSPRATDENSTAETAPTKTFTVESVPNKTSTLDGSPGNDSLSLPSKPTIPVSSTTTTPSTTSLQMSTVTSTSTSAKILSNHSSSTETLMIHPTIDNPGAAISATTFSTIVPTAKSTVTTKSTTAKISRLESESPTAKTTTKHPNAPESGLGTPAVFSSNMTTLSTSTVSTMKVTERRTRGRKLVVTDLQSLEKFLQSFHWDSSSPSGGYYFLSIFVLATAALLALNSGLCWKSKSSCRGFPEVSYTCSERDAMSFRSSIYVRSSVVVFRWCHDSAELLMGSLLASYLASFEGVTLRVGIAATCLFWLSFCLGRLAYIPLSPLARSFRLTFLATFLTLACLITFLCSVHISSSLPWYFFASMISVSSFFFSLVSPSFQGYAENFPLLSHRPPVQEVLSACGEAFIPPLACLEMFAARDFHLLSMVTALMMLCLLSVLGFEFSTHSAPRKPRAVGRKASLASENWTENGEESEVLASFEPSKPLLPP